MILFTLLGIFLFGGFILSLVYIFVTVAYEYATGKVAPWRRRSARRASK